MKQLRVRFNNMEQIRSFINVIDKFETNFEMGSGEKMVNAKSILGVCALDLNELQWLRYDSNDKYIIDKLLPFLCQEQ